MSLNLLHKAMFESGNAGTRRKSVLEKAQEEVGELLKQEQAGTLSREELQAGLKEIQKHLEVMDVFIHSCV
jgi:hypothetical protein